MAQSVWPFRRLSLWTSPRDSPAEDPAPRPPARAPHPWGQARGSRNRGGEPIGGRVAPLVGRRCRGAEPTHREMARPGCEPSGVGYTVTTGGPGGGGAPAGPPAHGMLLRSTMDHNWVWVGRDCTGTRARGSIERPGPMGCFSLSGPARPDVSVADRAPPICRRLAPGHQYAPLHGNGCGGEHMSWHFPKRR